MPLKNDFEGSFRGNLDSRRASAREIEAGSRRPRFDRCAPMACRRRLQQVSPQSGQCGGDLLFFEDAPDEAVNQDLLLRTRQAEVPFRSKNVAIQVCNPLPASGSDVEVANGGLDEWRDALPIKLRI